MTTEELLIIPDAEFTRLVNAAFKTYDSLLDLSRSSLAHSSLVQPAIILDELAPTSDDRGRALRVMLRWAVSRLAPSVPAYPLGTPRPFDDPTWSNPLWWGYNLLRHRYVEPLTPDARDDLGERGFLGALLSLTGIRDADSFYIVRQQAILTVSHLLRQQLTYMRHTDEIQRLALDELLGGLDKQESVLKLLGVAATFRGAFSRDLLWDLLAAEGAPPLLSALSYTLDHRLLQVGDGASKLWMSPALQGYLHTQQPAEIRRRRHERVVRYYQDEDNPLETAWHLRQAGNLAGAATLLLSAAPMLIGELQSKELHTELVTFTARQLPVDLWFHIQRLRSDVHRKLGEREAALATCRTALRVAATPGQQAEIYQRMGKLYEESNQFQALDYYQRAISRFDLHSPELVNVLKDRAWIHIHRQEWSLAQADLQQAQTLAAPDHWQQHADIHNALASLHRQRKEYDLALKHARNVCTWREEAGDIQLTAEARNNLALIYAEMQETDAAIATYREALSAFRKLNNQEAICNVLLNIGVALHHAQRLAEATDYYRQSLSILEPLYVPLMQSKIYYNLAEVYIVQGDLLQAQRFWQEGYTLSQQAGLGGEITWYEELRQVYPALQPAPRDIPAHAPPPANPTDLITEDLVALNLALTSGCITNRALQEACGISKPTATRKLTRLAEQNLLEKRGQGRSVQYFLTESGRQSLMDQFRQPGYVDPG